MLETPPAPRSAGSSSAGDGRPAGPGSSGHRVVRRRRRLAHQPALDGLRGIAVAAVVLYHGAAADGIRGLVPWTRGGFLGVSAFFTLSGFLICSLLVMEHHSSGSVSLRRFWSRRFRRLMPASLLLLGAVVILTPIVGTESQLDGLPGDVWASLAYVVNWRFIFSGSDYAAQFAGTPSPVKHLWSLSIEEQWYLLVPIVAAVALAVRRTGSSAAVRRTGSSTDRATEDGRRRFAVVLGVGAALSVVLMIVLGGGDYSNRVYMGTDTRFAEMAVGALLGVALAGRLRLGGRARRAAVVAGPIALVVMLALWARTPLQASWLYRGGLALHALLVAVVILASVQSAGPVRRLLGLAPLVALGRISYGVYLFHWPILWWVTPERLHLSPVPALVAQCAITVALATVSFVLIETPVRSGRLVTSWRRPVVIVAAIAAIAVGAAFLPDPDPDAIIAVGNNPRLVVPTVPGTTVVPSVPAADGAPAGADGDTTATTTIPAPAEPLKVMVVGDSFADSVVMGLQRWGLTTGNMAVLDATITGCGFGRGGRNKGVGFNRTWSDECRARDATIKQDLAEFDPDLVLMAGGMWDVTDRLVPQIGRWTHIGDPAYDDYFLGELQHVADLASSQGATVVWANSPHWDPIPGSVIFMGEPPYSESEPARADRFNELLSLAVASRPEVRLLDLASWMRAQPGGELDPGLRVDGVHFTEASTDIAAAWIGPQLLGIAGRS